MSLKPPHLLASHERLGVLNGWFSVFVGILALFGQVLGAFLGGKKVEVAGVRQQPKGWFQTRFFLTLTWGRFPICLFLDIFSITVSHNISLFPEFYTISTWISQEVDGSKVWISGLSHL